MTHRTWMAEVVSVAFFSLEQSDLFQKKTLKSVLILFFALPCFAATSAPAQELAKPTVAVQQPIIGEGIPQSLDPYLNIETVWSEIEAALRATRRFDVVTRDVSKLKEIRKEQRAARSELFRKNAARQGGLQNADYFVFPTVQDFEFQRINQPVPNISNKFITRESGLLGLSIQWIDTETGQIKSTLYVKSDLSTRDQVVNVQGGAPSRVLFSQLAKDAASRFSDQLIDAVFPMSIINVEGGTIWINRGADGGLKPGQTLRVYRPGKQLVDPYTKEKLGTAEAYIGKAKILRVDPKLTTAEIVERQTSETVRNGDILRKP